MMDNSIVKSNRLFNTQYFVAAITVILPILAFIGGFIYFWKLGIHPFYIYELVVMHIIGMLGISVGYHRLASHTSFKSKKWIKCILLIMGSMSAQGPVIYWATNHRRHHHKCDKPGDVHSPYFTEKGESLDNRFHGLIQAHTGWMFKSNPSNPIKYSLDLLNDPDVKFVNKHYYLWIFLGLIIPALVAFLYFQTIESFLIGFLISAIRIFTVQHSTWSINSLTHMFGNRPFKTRDKSTNLFWLCLFTTGESWHNNHHAFPYSSRLGLYWWQLDLGWILLKILNTCGLVWELKLPSNEQLEKKKVFQEYDIEQSN